MLPVLSREAVSRGLTVGDRRLICGVRTWNGLNARSIRKMEYNPSHWLDDLGYKAPYPNGANVIILHKNHTFR